MTEQWLVRSDEARTDTPSTDRRVRAALVTSMRVGIPLLHEHVSRVLGVDIFEQQGEQLVALALLDIYSHALIDGEMVGFRPRRLRTTAWLTVSCTPAPIEKAEPNERQEGPVEHVNGRRNSRPRARHRPADAGRCRFSLGRVRPGYAVTSVSGAVWLGRSSSSSPVRRAWAKPKRTSTAMTPARQKAAIAHQKAMAAIRLKP